MTPTYLPLTALLLIISLTANAQKLTPDAFEQTWKQTPIPQLIDVRTPAEFGEGHLPKARNVDVQGADFARQIATLDKSKPVFVYCLSGGRSGRAAAQLRELGYTNVYDLEGGYLKWSARMKPIEGARTTGSGTSVGLTASQLSAAVSANSVVLVDVYAPWCGPCKKMMPTIDKLTAELAGKALILKANADGSKPLLAQYQVDEIPTLLLFRDGKLVRREVGYRDETALRKLVGL
jgi:thioredoxin